MTFFDISVRRESACPVHFVWDGNGAGRPVVRVGFMLILLAGGLASFAVMAHAPAVRSAALVVGGVAVFVWGLGQVLTKLTVLRLRRH